MKGGKYFFREMTSQLEDLLTFLRFPSVSTESKHVDDVRRCAEWLMKKLNGMGLQAELHETPQHPIVIAKNEHKEGRKTVMIYGHYDVQPVDPVSLWDTDPFEPVVRDGKIWARGATDNKGQMLAHLLGVEKTLKERGELPVNLIFLFEGEEEIGSPNLVPFIEKNKKKLECDVIAVSDTGMVAPGIPTMGYGLRGISCCEIKLIGPTMDQHSGVYGGAVANPATEIARLVSTIHDEDGRIAIEGFYDDVVDLEPWEREMWAKVPGMAESDLLRITGSPSLHGEVGYTGAECLWGRPTAEVNGIGGGYQREGSKTVLPSEAMAKLSFRLVPDQDPKDIIAKVQAHCEKHVSTHVRMEFEIGHDGGSYYCDPHSDAGKAAQRALKTTFGKEPVLIREGGSIPIIQSFKEILGVETLMLGLALPDCQIHAPNENFTVENFEAGIILNQNLLEELAK